MRLQFAALALLLVTGCASGTQAAETGSQATQPPAPATTTPARSSTPPNTGPAKPATQRVVIRPVTATGRLAEGFTAVPGTQGPAECTGTSGPASPAAVDGGIVECSPAFLDAVACWRASTARSVLCYRDPWSTQLTLLPTDGPVAAAAALRTPSPLGLLLADGTRCWLRIGGAWSRLDGHPELFGTYGCQNQIAVWGRADADGIDRSGPVWTVRLAPMSGHGTLRTVAVRTGYYVGTATTA
jgi:hypothetical protein